MSTLIRKAAVLGAGVMGSTIAAHLANSGIPTLLLDMVPSPQPGESPQQPLRNLLAEKAIAATRKASPAAFAHPDRACYLTAGNFEDDLHQLASVDWVIEAVVERLDIKIPLLQRVTAHLAEHAILTTNTSGLSINEMAEALPDSVRPRFFGTHFFNPPRYMYLLEIIPSRWTDAERLTRFTDFSERRLGKGVVEAQDSVNFIANRVGVFSMLYTVQAMQKYGLTVEQVDALTGTAMARPRSATFRTADMVGLDVLAHAAADQFEYAEDDEMRHVFALPPWIQTLLERGQLGLKSGGGFYCKQRKNGESKILSIDPDTGEYRPKERVTYPILQELSRLDDPGKRVALLLDAPDPVGGFCRDVLFSTFLYAARRIPAASPDVVSVDRAMRWGFGWQLGPFELWDDLGVGEMAERMRRDGHEIPPAIEALIQSDTPHFYHWDQGLCSMWNPVAAVHQPLQPRPGVTRLGDLKRLQNPLYSNQEATLLDLGDGVACLEFHSKANAIGGGILQAIHATLREAGNAYQALVIGNQGENFSVGANLMLILFEALEGNVPEIDAMVRAFQEANMALKYAPVPVIAAPFGRVLGGGTEICLHCHRIQAHLETYMGLVEMGVGLVPAGGGSKEMLLRSMQAFPKDTGADPLPFVRRAFETIGLAKVSTSAMEAKTLGFLRDGDGITMNREHLITDAKKAALATLESGWQPLLPPAKVSVMGIEGTANIVSMLHNMRAAGQISEHDAFIGERVGRILCGGEVEMGAEVSEHQILDLERKAFLELCVQRKTLERIQHMLKAGKPLRN